MDDENKTLKFLGERIHEIRTEKGISLLKLEKLTGIDNSNLSKIERGKINVTASRLQRIAHALGCRLDFVRGKLK